MKESIGPPFVKVINCEYYLNQDQEQLFDSKRNYQRSASKCRAKLYMDESITKTLKR